MEIFYDEGRVGHTVLVTLGRLDQRQASSHIDALLASGARFAKHVLLLTARRSSTIGAT